MMREQGYLVGLDPWGLLLGLAGFGLVFAVLERLQPARPQQRFLRRGFGTDALYWFFTPLVTKPLTSVIIGICVVLAAIAAGVRPSADHLEAFFASRGFVDTLPLWLQVLSFFLLADLLGYLAHRLLHAPTLWPIHAVHHSSEEVDWLSAVRVHPLNDLFARLLQALPLVLFGFNPLLLAAWVPVLVFYSLLQHANVGWTFGPLRYVLVSPAFHRWHHAETRAARHTEAGLSGASDAGDPAPSEASGESCNFAAVFPIWDLLFGTFRMPVGELPARYGTPDDEVPAGLAGQMFYPFRRRSSARDREARA